MAMYKATVRALIRRNLRHLNAGHYEPLLKMYADDAVLTFPGDNSLSRQYRPPQAGRAASPTHCGRAEIEAFLQRCVDLGLQFQIEDILVNGPPWATRICVREHHWILDSEGNEVYANRAAFCVVASWGKIKSQEDYEDTERVAAYERETGVEASA
jgi:ketosteroid isomerase-like protein